MRPPAKFQRYIEEGVYISSVLNKEYAALVADERHPLHYQVKEIEVIMGSLRSFLVIHDEANLA